ncbi:MAG: hypothetical protein KAI83_05295 [Thiomargarita sp.]|nr:hypothetical protein [Thiomargarita sp.]
MGIFGVQRFSFGHFWSPTLQLWAFLESNASALESVPKAKTLELQDIR